MPTYEIIIKTVVKAPSASTAVDHLYGVLMGVYDAQNSIDIMVVSDDVNVDRFDAIQTFHLRSPKHVS